MSITQLLEVANRGYSLTNRWDETWHRLREWTNGQPPSERLAAQILLHEGYTDLDPSHPLGGRDGTKDAICQKDGQRWVMAVYFPRGQKSFNDIEEKFLNDFKGVQSNKVDAIAFVTNQELRLAEREALCKAAGVVSVDLFHLEKITAILDKPEMHGVRKQFLGIDNEATSIPLGGEGGKAPGAGGGGGGAFGFDVQGGDGGSGGNIFFLDGQSAEVPGAGGGGGGAIGDGAVGGEGGGGGEYVEYLERVEDLLRIGNLLEVKVGRAGRGAENGDGEDGEESVINILQDDGNKVELLRAKGGKGGRSGWTLKQQQQQAAMESSSARLWISSALLANYAEIRDGLIHTLGCGWDSYTMRSFPCYLGGYFVFVIEMGEAAIGGKYELLVRFLGVDSSVIGQAAVAVERNNSSEIVRHNMTIPFQIEVTTPGIWTAQVLIGDDELVRVPFEIRQFS